jgi:hypothetical protein
MLLGGLMALTVGKLPLPKLKNAPSSPNKFALGSIMQLRTPKHFLSRRLLIETIDSTSHQRTS